VWTIVVILAVLVVVAFGFTETRARVRKKQEVAPRRTQFVRGEVHHRAVSTIFVLCATAKGETIDGVVPRRSRPASGARRTFITIRTIMNMFVF
jgi:hypothetical protein